MAGGGPVVVALGSAAVFGEVLPPVPTIGVVLVCSGIVAFASGHADRRATLFALANALVIGAYTVVDAKGARASGSPVAYAMWFFVANGIAIYAYAGLRRGAEVARYVARHWRRSALGAVLTTGTYGIALWAMTVATVALVAELRVTSVLLADAFGAILFKEKFTRRRLVATGAVLCGLVALRL